MIGVRKWEFVGLSTAYKVPCTRLKTKSTIKTKKRDSSLHSE
jgi:hypothetical protein